MKVKLTDVIHLYLGCEVLTTRTGETPQRGKLTPLLLSELRAVDRWNHGERTIKLCLKPLEWLTPVELLEVKLSVHPTYWRGHMITMDVLTPMQTVLLCKKGYDLFGLIDSEQAVVFLQDKK